MCLFASVYTVDFLQEFRGASPPPGTDHEASHGGEPETETKHMSVFASGSGISWISDYPRRTQDQSVACPSHSGVPATKRLERSPEIYGPSLITGDLSSPSPRLPSHYTPWHGRMFSLNGQRGASNCSVISGVGFPQFLSWPIPTFNRDSQWRWMLASRVWEVCCHTAAGGWEATSHFVHKSYTVTWRVELHD